MGDCNAGLYLLSGEARNKNYRCFTLQEMELSGSEGILNWLGKDPNNVIIYLSDTIYCFNRANFGHISVEKDEDDIYIAYYILYDPIFKGRKVSVENYRSLYDYDSKFYKFTGSKDGVYKVCAYTIDNYREAVRRLY